VFRILLFMSAFALVATFAPVSGYAAENLLARADTATDEAEKSAKKSVKKKDKRVCKRERKTGSRIPERVCRKESEWKKQQERARESVETTREERMRSTGAAGES
jgi:hypothetical protein